MLLSLKRCGHNTVNDKTSEHIILSDTNVAYVLSFFLEKKIIPERNIFLGEEKAKVEFHPIVKEEIEAHFTAWLTCRELNISTKNACPSFFDSIGKSAIEKILKFVSGNLAPSLTVNITSNEFFNRKKVYEAVRKKIQTDWALEGVKGKKISSKPSDQDYSILFSVEKNLLKLATNDEILLAIARELLVEGSTYKTEDLINLVYLADSSVEEKIKEVCATLSALDQTFSLARALRPKVLR